MDSDISPSKDCWGIIVVEERKQEAVYDTVLRDRCLVAIIYLDYESLVTSDDFPCQKDSSDAISDITPLC